jgi:hypothetical protein
LLREPRRKTTSTIAERGSGRWFDLYEYSIAANIERAARQHIDTIATDGDIHRKRA